MKVDDFIRYINNTLYVRHICHGWNCKRCIFLQLNIKRCLWDVKIPTSLGNMSAALVNETPQLYVQATSCLPLHVLKLLNVKPDFVMLELQLISRRLKSAQTPTIFAIRQPTDSINDHVKMDKRVSSLL